MMYAPKGTYDMEAMGWEELRAFDVMVDWTEEKVDAYEDAIYALYEDCVPSDEAVDKVAKEFDVPYDYVEFEGWLFVED